jgi:predicted nucleotide-binding protein
VNFEFTERFRELEERLKSLELTKTIKTTSYGTSTTVDQNALLEWGIKVKNLINQACDKKTTYFDDFLKAEQIKNSYMGNMTRFNAMKSVFKATKEDYLIRNSNKMINQNEKTEVKATDKSKVFIVHGRDELAKIETARFIEKLGLSPIILHEQANLGKTIIEKIEEHTNVGFGIVLYTPCDVGGLDDKNLKSRARQNVVFEHGYLIAKLGRQKVCALVKGNIETPGDINGIVYIPLDDHEGWHNKIAKELRNAGYSIDMNKI